MALFSSSTRQVPETVVVPRHVAVIMDGNGRWAKKRFLPRVAGHVKGVELLREMVRELVLGPQAAQPAPAVEHAE